MLVSHTQKKFLFVHVYKTAGMSLRAALIPYLLTPFQRSVNKVGGALGRKEFFNCSPLPKHASARECIDHFGEKEFLSYESFAVVRNPWDWQVSLYNYMMKNSSHRQHDLISSFKGFDGYVRWRCGEEVKLQRDLVCEPGTENVLVKRLMRFETLEADYGKFCLEMKISCDLPHLNKSSERPWRENYTDETAGLVAAAFQADIDLFGYSFE